MRGLYWSDFWKLVLKNANPSSCLKTFGPNKEYPDKIDIYDRSLPRKRGLGKTSEEITLLGNREYDHWRDSFVCSTSFHNGMIPLKSKASYVNNGHTLDHKGTYKGAVDTINQLLVEGCLIRSMELESWLRKAESGQL